MSNKLTRKSLAFGALVALASSAIAGAPAQAAGEVVFAPSTGTSYNTLVTESFALQASLAPGQVAGNISQLKYKIDSATASSVVFGINTAAVATVAAGSTGPASTTSFVVAPATTPSPTVANVINLRLASATAATDTTSVTVTAFLDSNNDNLLTAGEFEQARTVKFVKYSEVVPTVAFSVTPAVGDVAVKATVTLADVNNEQLGVTATAKGGVDVVFARTGTTFTATTKAAGVFTSSAIANPGLVAADVVTAQATFTSVAPAATTNLGTAATVTVAARTIATITADEVVSDNAIASGSARLNSAYSVKAEVKSSATGTPGVAGVPVTAVVTSARLTGTAQTGISLSVNGTVYTTSTALAAASIVLTSDATGSVLVNIVPVGFSANDTIAVSLTAQNLTPVVVTTTQAALTYTMTDSQDDTASAFRAIARGGSVSFNLEVKDQFGVGITGSSRVLTTVSGGTTVALAYTPVVAGKATVTVKDTQTTTTTAVTVQFGLETQNSSTLNWATQAFTGFGTGTPAVGAVSVAVSATAPGFASAPAAGVVANLSTATKLIGTVTPDAYTATAPTGGVALLNYGIASPYATATTSAGQQVTVAGAGELFLVNGKYFKDTVTFFSGASGAFAVTAFSQTAGDQVVTITTGTTTATVTITFAAGPVALVTLTAPAQAQVGQALDVVVKTTDKWGNAQGSALSTAAADAGKLSLTSTGTGYFASNFVQTNATTGLATVKYIVGTADIGTAFLSATLDLATDVTGARSIEFGLTDGDVLAGGKRVFVSAEFAKGRTVSVSINGKRIYSKVQTTDNAVELAFTQRRAGTYTVTVRISGGIVFTEKVRVN
jgi:trimeric autotransporter adhesin